MHFAFSDDQLAFRDAVRDLLADRCGPDVVRAAWEGDGFARATWAQLAAMGVAGLTAPEGAGGLGMGELDWVLLAEEAGRAALPAPFAETTAVAIPLLAAAGDTSWVPKLAAGDAIAAVGFEGHPFVTFAGTADVYVLQAGNEVHAVAADDAVLVPVESVDRSRRLARVEWIPGDGTLVGAGDWDLAFDRGCVALAAQLVGLADTLVAVAVEYAKARHQFGVPIGSYQAVKHHLANAHLRTSYARPVVHAAAWALATGQPTSSRDASFAKAYAAEAAALAARAALQVHGAIGYTWEHDLHLWMKRAWALAAMWGDAAWHRRRVADALGL